MTATDLNDVESEDNVGNVGGRRQHALTDPRAKVLPFIGLQQGSNGSVRDANLDDEWNLARHDEYLPRNRC